MKTLKLTLLLAGIFCISSIYAFTIINLPIDEALENPNETILEFDNQEMVMQVVKPDKTNVDTKKMKDTILIDLANETVVDPFPSASRNCIMKQVPYPRFAEEKQLEGGVAVRFAFDQDGNVQVKEAFSNSPELENYVVDCLSNLQLKNCVVDMNKDYYLRFMFRMF